MLNRRATLIRLLFVFSVTSIALGQNVEVLKAELKGVEGQLDTKIDGAVGQLDTKIDGVKNELTTKIEGTEKALINKIEGTEKTLNTSINGVKDQVVTIKWIISGVGALFLAFLGYLVHLLHVYVNQVLLNKRPSETRLSQQEPTSGEGFADNAQSDYQTVGGGS